MTRILKSACAGVCILAAPPVSAEFLSQQIEAVAVTMDCAYTQECINGDCNETSYTATAKYGFTGNMEAFGIEFTDVVETVRLKASMPMPSSVAVNAAGVDDKRIVAFSVKDTPDDTGKAISFYTQHLPEADLVISYLGHCVVAGNDAGQ